MIFFCRENAWEYFRKNKITNLYVQGKYEYDNLYKTRSTKLFIINYLNIFVTFDLILETKTFEKLVTDKYLRKTFKIQSIFHHLLIIARCRRLKASMSVALAKYLIKHYTGFNLHLLPLICRRVTAAIGTEEKPRPLFLQLLLGDSKVFPGQRR